MEELHNPLFLHSTTCSTISLSGKTVRPTLAWVHRSADPIVQCYFAGSSVILWHIWGYFLQEIAVYEDALFSCPVSTRLRVTFVFLEQKSLHFLAQVVDTK